MAKKILSIQGLKPEDCPIDIVRVFKVKLYSMIKDLTKNAIFSRVKASLYLLVILLIYIMLAKMVR